MGFLSVPNLVPWLIFRAWIVMVSFDEFHSSSTWRRRDKRKRRWRKGRGRGDYSREAIILSISIKGRRLFEGRLLFEEIRYLTCASSTGPSSLALVFATCTSPITHLICPPPPPHKKKKKKKLASPLFFISPGHYSLAIFQGERSDHRKCVCCSQAKPSREKLKQFFSKIWDAGCR